MGITVLSLFDGMSCGMIALDKLGIKVDKYFASEIDKHAIKVSNHNYPNIIRIGDVTKVKYQSGKLFTECGEFDVGSIDLLIGGSPCQTFSIARTFQNEITGLDGKSGLFYEYLRILNEIKVDNKEVKFLLENVKMKNDSKLQLDKYLGVSGILINSALLSYQIRHRYYWTNIENVTLPQDLHISFQDFKETNEQLLKKYKLNKTPSRIKSWSNGVGRNNGAGSANVTHSDKVYCLTTKQDRTPNSGLVEYEDFCRYLTQTELEQAQTVPVGYTSCLSYNQACAVLGNGWTVDVIAHILSFAKFGKMEKEDG